MRPLNMKLRASVQEESLNTIFFAKLNLIMSFSFYESLCKKTASSASSNGEVAVIKFLNAEGVTGSKIHRRLGKVYGAPYPWPKM